MVALEVAGFLLRLVAPGGQLRHKRDADAADEDPRDQVAILRPSAAHAGNLNLEGVQDANSRVISAFSIHGSSVDLSYNLSDSLISIHVKI